MTELDAAYALVRQSIGCGRADSLPAGQAQWWRMFRLLQQNHVAALCCEAASASGAPREVLVPWMAEREKAVAWHRYQRRVQDDIVAAMSRHGIDTMVLKGTRTARFYPAPELREFGDIDLFFHDRHAEADRVAADELGVEVGRSAHHHTKYDYRGVTVESHYDFVNRHTPPSNRRYEQLLKAAVGGAEFEPLFLLRHMAGHFASARITLRDLCDWALLWCSEVGGINTEACGEVVARFGMLRFTAALHAIAVRRLGVEVPSFGGEADEATVRRVERDIVYGSPEAVEHEGDGVGRLLWKTRRWRSMRWKRRLVYSDSAASMLLSSILSHAEKPASILHKQ
ncbi:MAG: nucleotidyltransferase family protein [Bacteroidales bacterium]|nr:nucleotidyltransferase family protein [Bacteroidales bacterium]